MASNKHTRAPRRMLPGRRPKNRRYYRWYLSQTNRPAGRQWAELVTRLYNLSAALSEDLAPSQVADIVIRHSVLGLGARAGLVALLSEDRDALHMVRSIGYPNEQAERWSVIPTTTPSPLADAVRLAQPVLVTSLSEMQTRYHHLSPEIRPGHLAWAAIPLLLDDRAIGAIGLTFAETRDFNPEELEFMLALAGQCAQALERARLYAAEAWARDAATVAQLHLAVLAEAGKHLALSLDEEATLAKLQKMIVPVFADQCCIDLLVETGTVRRVLYSGANPLPAPPPPPIELFYPVNPHAPDHPVLKVIRTGTAKLLPELTEAQVSAFAFGVNSLNQSPQTKPESAMIVPLSTQGHTFGAVSFLWAGSGRRYEPADLALAKDLANRAALALNNARLYRRALAEIAERKQAETALQAKNEQLQQALDQVKTLSGLLPICANCNKIRDDQGYWQEVTVYIKTHSEVDFTHGICPDCLQTLYPDFYGP